MADILVISSETLRTRRGEVMKRVFRFIDVDPHVACEEKFAMERHVSSKNSRKTAAAVLLRRLQWGKR